MSFNHTSENVAYDDDQVDGAWPNGTRIVKTRCLDPAELTPVGSLGRVIGSMAMPPDAVEEQRERGLEDVKFGYFIMWDYLPDMPVFCIDKKLMLADPNAENQITEELKEQASFFLFMIREGYTDLRPIPGDRWAGIKKFMYTHAIIMGQHGNRTGYEDRWCYHTYEDAMKALEAWDGTGEPSGWHRHPISGRRRKGEQEWVEH